MGADDFRALLEPGAIRAVFQPIVRLADLGVIGYEGLSRFPTPPGLVALPPDVTLAAAERDGLRQELEVACWAAIAAAGVPPQGRALWVNLVARGARPSRAARGRRPAHLAARDRADRAGRRAEPHAAAAPPAPVDRARRARRGRRRRRRLHVARVRRRHPPGLPQALARHGRRRRRRPEPRRRAARDRRVRERGRRARGGRGRRARRGARGAARDGDRLGQGWLFGRPPAPWPQDRVVRARAARRASAGGRLERDLERAECARDACEAVADHLARRGLLPSVYLAQSGRLRCQAVRGFWQVYDGVPPTAGHRRPRASAPARPRSSTTSATRPTTCPRPRRALGDLRAAARRRAGRRRARRVVGDHAIDGSRRPRSSAAPRCCRARLEAARRRPSASPAQQLARTAARLARSTTPRTSCARRSPPSLELAGFESACSRSPTATAALPAPRRGLVRGRASASSRPTSSAAIAQLGRRRHLQLHGRRRRRARLRRPRGAAPARRRRRSSCCRWPPPDERLGHARARRPRNHRPRSRRSSCSSCWPARPPARCGWPPPCPSCASARRATR